MLSLDFFKAYDRVMVDFLILVMRKMNFSEKFCKWVRMLHVGAKTKFILQFLTKTIEVSFSIRQGDPLSMILYIIYIEPLLIYLEKHLDGIKVAGVPQCIEAYCDDSSRVRPIPGIHTDTDTDTRYRYIGIGISMSKHIGIGMNI